MSEVLQQALIGGAAMFLSVIFSTLLGILIPKKRNSAKKDTKDSNKGDDTVLKVDAKVLKNSPVTVNTDKLIELIEDAERHENFSSLEKLDYVLTSYQQYCIDSNFKFVKEVIADAVNKMIDLTKKVNQRDKDKTVEETTDLNTNL